MNFRLWARPAAGVFAVAVVARYSIPAQAPATGTTAVKDTRAAVRIETAPSAGSGATKPEYEVPEGPWLASRHFFRTVELPVPDQLHDGNDSGMMEQCAALPSVACKLTDLFGLPHGFHPTVVIATVPDPLHTRLGLFTDSSITAIQKGAEARHWEFATQWLPWEDSIDPDEKSPQKRREQRGEVRRNERQPGLLVFRKSHERLISDSNEALFVFIVGETPTAGINPTQFRLAHSYLRAFGTPGPALVLGPTFSGSFQSLGRLINDTLPQNDTPPPKWTIRSGTATSVKAEQFLQKACDVGNCVDFASTTANGDDQDQFLLDTLDAFDIKPAQAAILVEDESTYGNASVVSAEFKKYKGLHIFRFPRDISHLRNAYREAVGAAKTEGAPEPDLDFSLKDPTGEDSIPTFSNSQTPLSQNAVVNQIAAEIRRDQIRLVELTATNVLDLLFLTRLLRKECPDTRLLISTPDLLFTEAYQTQSFTGMLALSSYPLFPASSEWSGKPRGLVFPDVHSEGVFNAMALLLPDTETATKDKEKAEAVDDDVVADYRWNGLNHAPEWLLMLDREGFIPVQVIVKGVAPPWRNWFPVAKVSQKVSLALPIPSRAWNVLAALIGTSGLCLTVWMIGIWLCPSARLDARFSLRCHSDDDRWRLLYVFLFLILLTSIGLALSIPAWSEPPTQIARFFTYAGSLCAMLTALVLAFRLTTPRRDCLLCVYCCEYDRTDYMLVTLVILALAGFLIGITCWCYLCFGLRANDASFFFTLRAIALRPGSSPVLPVASALCGLLSFSLLHITRHYIRENQLPEILLTDFTSALQLRMQQAHTHFTELLHSPIGLTRDSFSFPLYAVFGLLALGSGLAFLGIRPGIRLATVEGQAYSVLSILIQSFLLLLLLHTGWMVTNLWNSLQMFLTCLNTLPLGRAFIQPDGLDRSLPIWIRHLNVQSLDVHIRSLVILHDISLMPEKIIDFDENHKTYIKHVTALLDSEQRGRSSVVESFSELRGLSRKMAGHMHRDVLRDYWRREPLVGKVGKDNKADSGANENQNLPLLIHGDPSSIGSLAETFLALHYTPFILYGVRQIRNLLIFLSVGFVFFLFSLKSYGFQSPYFLSWLLGCLLALVAWVGWRCLAGMERNPVLSLIAGSSPGELNAEFYVKLAAFVAGPALGILASTFPAISNFLYSWIAPGLQTLR